MEFRTYEEFYNTLKTLLPNWDIYLGTTKENVTRQTCFISHNTSVTEYADGVPFLISTTYDLIFLQKRPAFTNLQIMELLDDGVNFNVYDEDSGFNIFTASVTLYGPRSIPDE